MNWKEWWTGRKEKPVATPVAEPTRVGFSGKELHVNPSEELTLARIEGRLDRVTKLLSTKFTEGHPRHEKMSRTKRRLELQLKLKKGEY